MTWDETIRHIQDKATYANLVDKAYLSEDLVANIEKFKQGIEFTTSLKLLKKIKPNATTLLDIGSGNGISCINFAFSGYQTTAVEPDDSKIVGSQAIKYLINHYQLKNLSVFESFAEKMPFPDQSFDIVYARQAMHHAHDLSQFLAEIGRVLKKGGLLFTVRDHVIFNKKDKDRFLKNHPLQKFYGGENAYSPKAYKMAMKEAGLTLNQELRYLDNPINFYPKTKESISLFINTIIHQELQSKIGRFANIQLLQKLYKYSIDCPNLVEQKVSGRMYSYIAIKQ